MASDEHDKNQEHEHKPEEHKEEGSQGGENTFKKHKTLWIVGGVGAAGVLLLLFMNSGGSSSSNSSGQNTDTGASDLNTQGAGGAVDTSNLVGSGGYPSWYNPGAAENMDYWPYVPNSGSSSSSSSSGSKSSGSGSSSKSGSSSGSSKSKSGSSSGSSKNKSGSSSGSSKSSSKKKSVKPDPHAGGAHGHVITTKKGDTLQSLQKYAFGNSNANIYQYANNSKILKLGKNYNSKGQIKPGTKLSI